MAIGIKADKLKYNKALIKLWRGRDNLKLFEDKDKFKKVELCLPQ